ncbi:MAG: hypothetical protein U0798_06595 [Gemmataceae bacterium]
MPVAFPAHPFLNRLPRFQTAKSWTKLARNPSYLAPRAEDVQTPTTFAPPRLQELTRNQRLALDAVLARPGDDAPRLAYAEQSKDDSEFIRVQLAIARERRAGTIPPIELLDRESNLLPLQQAKWSERLAPWGATDLVFRRGWIERLTLTGRAFLSLGSALFDSLPLHGVRLIAVKWYGDELARCPHLERLARLDLEGNRIGSQGLKQLSLSPFLLAVRELGLSGNQLGDGDVERLTSLPLRLLDLSHNNLTTFDGTRFTTLESLNLSGNRMKRLPALPASLRLLNLSGCGLGPGPAISETVTELDLSFNPDGNMPARCHDRVTSLSLRGNRLADVSRLPDALPRVRSLDLGANFFGDALGGWLARVLLNSLTSLDLTNTLLGRKGLFQLIESGRLATLYSLNLSWNGLGDESLMALAQCPDIRQLRSLDVTGTGIGRRGIQALQRSPYLGNLREFKS